MGANPYPKMNRGTKTNPPPTAVALAKAAAKNAMGVTQPHRAMASQGSEFRTNSRIRQQTLTHPNPPQNDHPESANETSFCPQFSSDPLHQLPFSRSSGVRCQNRLRAANLKVFTSPRICGSSTPVEHVHHISRRSWGT